MQDIEPVGNVELQYNDTGKIENAIFHPKIKVRHGCGLIKNLAQIDCCDQRAIKDNADKVMAQWFYNVSQIELANREQYELSGTVVEVDKRHAVINYEMRKRC